MSTDTFSYSELYDAWKEETFSKNLAPLSLNFIQNTLFSLEQLNKTNNTPVEAVLVQRANFLIKSLIELRKYKILTIILKKEKIESSYLSKQELLFYDFFKNSENILHNKPLNFTDQLISFLDENSNVSRNHSFLVPEKNKKGKENDEGNENDMITVIFLKEIEEFIYIDKSRYGPYKTNDVASIPLEIYNKILLPKQIAKEK